MPLLLWRHNWHDSASNHQPHLVYSTIYSGADQRKHQNSVLLAFVRGNHRRPVNSPHKGPVTRTMFPFDDVIMGNAFNGVGCALSGHNLITWFKVLFRCISVYLDTSVGLNVKYFFRMTLHQVWDDQIYLGILLIYSCQWPTLAGRR